MWDGAGLQKSPPEREAHNLDLAEDSGGSRVAAEKRPLDGGGCNGGLGPASPSICQSKNRFNFEWFADHSFYLKEKERERVT